LVIARALFIIVRRLAAGSQVGLLNTFPIISVRYGVNTPVAGLGARVKV
jgi:hypothetical protein